MIDAPFCNAVSLLTGFTGWVLAVWSFLRPERDRSGWKLAGGGMACIAAPLRIRTCPLFMRLCPFLSPAPSAVPSGRS